MEQNQKLTEINRSVLQRLVSNGKITIPNEIREIYDLKDGDMLEVLIIGFYRNNVGDGGGTGGEER